MLKITAVILVGPLDFGRCELASHLSPSLWPMLDTPVLCNTVNQLHSQGIEDIVICAKQHSQQMHSCPDISEKGHLEVIYDDLPEGTAGSLRNAARDKKDTLLFVLPAAITVLPQVKPLIDKHLQEKSDLTVLFNPALDSSEQIGRCSEIYLCHSDILSYIPDQGYFDIKEHLVPKLVKDDKKVVPIVADSAICSFRNVPDYLSATADYLKKGDLLSVRYPDLKNRREYGEDVFIAESADIDQTVRIIGPAVVFDNVKIEKNTVIAGPAVIGKDCWIGPESVISDSVLWQGSSVGAFSRVKNSVVSYNTAVLSNSNLNGASAVASKRNIKQALNPVETTEKQLEKEFKWSVTAVIAAFIAVFLAFLWSYWPTFTELVDIWQNSDEYSAGMLVPFLAGYVIWTKRRELLYISVKPAMWGLVAIILSQCVRFFGLYFDYSSLERASFVATIASTVLFCMGWRWFSKLWPMLLFLFLMIPLPNRFNSAISLQLQNWATSSAVWMLEMLGYVIRREGNIIHLNNTSVAVAEACNGLRMITAFFVIGGWFALLIERKWWEKLIVFLSALPISLICNTLRLTITSIAFTIIDVEYWAEAFHDYGGYAMMPLAIAIIILELWVLKHIFISDDIENKVDIPDEADKKASRDIFVRNKNR